MTAGAVKKDGWEAKVYIVYAIHVVSGQKYLVITY